MVALFMLSLSSKIFSTLKVSKTMVSVDDIAEIKALTPSNPVEQLKKQAFQETKTLPAC